MAEPPPLAIEVVEPGALTPALRREVLRFCTVVFDEDLTELLEVASPSAHVLGRVGGRLVSHAMWCTRWLQPGHHAPLRTVYVEAVGTLPDFQRRGFASRIMRRLVAEIPGPHELAALCPATSEIYERLGWRFWRGALSVRMPDGTVMPTPEERVMIYDLPGRPVLDVDEPLSVEWRPGEEVW
jgi:aminoglycoside 2'-N-acetyltransferase I